MTRFAAGFLLVFGELAVGGILALAVPPFFEIDRGFYRSAASIYLGAGLLTTLGLGWLAASAGQRLDSLALACALWLLFCLVTALYLFSLWRDQRLLRARSYSLALGSGLLAVVINSLILKPASLGAAAGLAYVVTSVLSTAALGLVSGAMIFGHWYLLEPGLPVDYLRGFLRLVALALVAEVLGLGLAMGWLAMLGGDGGEAVRALVGSHSALLAMRVGLGPLASLGLAWLAWQTLKLPQTMAATGLLYIAVMSMLVGELLGRFILFRTAVPL